MAFLSAFSLPARRTGKVFSLNFVFILQATPLLLLLLLRDPHGRGDDEVGRVCFLV